MFAKLSHVLESKSNGPSSVTVAFAHLTIPQCACIVVWMAITCYFSNTIIKLGAKSPPNEGKSVFKQYLNTHPQPLEWQGGKEGGSKPLQYFCPIHAEYILQSRRRVSRAVTRTITWAGVRLENTFKFRSDPNRISICFPSPYHTEHIPGKINGIRNEMWQCYFCLISKLLLLLLLWPTLNRSMAHHK